MRSVIHMLKTFQKQRWTQASLRQARNPHWKAFKCQAKIQAWSSWGILDQWAPGQGGFRTRTVKAASLHRAASTDQPLSKVLKIWMQAWRRRASVISELYNRKVSDPRSCQSARFCGKIWPAQRVRWEDSQRPDVTSDRLPWHMGKLLAKSLQCKHASLSASSLGSVYKFPLSLR